MILVGKILNKLIALFILFFIWPILIIIAFIVFIDDGMPFLYSQNRIGLNNSTFIFYKFRTMKNNVPQVATHLLSNPSEYKTKTGDFLRKFSLDELPQLFNVIKGDMVFIGPRPALFNQQDLINKRRKLGVDKLIPGITGWAQVNGRDNITIDEKVELEKYYLLQNSISLNVKIIFMTLRQIFFPKNISH